jgi:hypothetical protein
MVFILHDTITSVFVTLFQFSGNRTKYLQILFLSFTAQMVSHQLPTMVIQVQFQVRSSEISSGQSGIQAGFLLVLQFPLSTLIPPTALHSLLIITNTI